jgi:2,4-dichlorophenol 6-monooxygenase
MGTFRAIRPWSEWIAGWGYDIDGPEPDLRPEAVMPRIREMIGDPDVEVEIENVTTWQINQAWATQYSKGRVFCGGDAVHRHPPSSGLGSNTSIQDAFNLSWKLAYVLQGWAGPRLLETYTDERAPVGKQVVARANQSRLDYGPINEAFRTEGQADAVAAGLAKLDDPSEAGIAAREALMAAIEFKNTEFNAHGTELNQRYESKAVIPDLGAQEEEFVRDKGLYLQATTRPGAKLPHVWLVDSSGLKVSTLDVTGKGQFTLITGVSGGAWVAAVDKLDLPFLSAVVIGVDGARDSYGDWRRASEIEEGGAILVRPDGYVAWRHISAASGDEAFHLLQDAVDSVLDR